MSAKRPWVVLAGTMALGVGAAVGVGAYALNDAQTVTTAGPAIELVADQQGAPDASPESADSPAESAQDSPESPFDSPDDPAFEALEPSRAPAPAPGRVVVVGDSADSPTAASVAASADSADATGSADSADSASADSADSPS